MAIRSYLVAQADRDKTLGALHPDRAHIAELSKRLMEIKGVVSITQMRRRGVELNVNPLKGEARGREFDTKVKEVIKRFIAEGLYHGLASNIQPMVLTLDGPLAENTL